MGSIPACRRASASLAARHNDDERQNVAIVSKWYICVMVAPKTNQSSRAAASGQTLLYNVTQAGPINVRIDLGCGNIGMAKQFLHDSKISAPSEHMSCKAVPEHVWVHILKTCPHCKAANNLPHSDPLKWTARA